MTSNSIFGRKESSCNDLHGGMQYKFTFDNGYSASVVRHEFSYGNEDGLWELAIIDKQNDICYTTPITDDVLGCLTVEEVDQYLTEIENLPTAV